MLITEQLKSWYTKFSKYKVTYKDGFFRLSNLANSPQTIVKSFDSMPFCKHSKEKGLITSGTMFLNAQLYYAELEEGLWIFVSDLLYKKNLDMTNIYDKALPMDFNFINLHYHATTLKSKSMLINGQVLTDKTWTVFKPGHALSDCHFKDAHEKNITVYFTNEWFKKQVAGKNHFANSSLNKFFQSVNTYLILPDAATDSDNFHNDFLALAQQNKNGVKNTEIRELLSVFFKQFITKYNNEAITDEQFKLSDTDRKYIQKAEQYMRDNLLLSFPGIENIAEKVGISPTKLKSNFKVVHNQSMYQYYRYHQMTLAGKMLNEKASTIKEVASLLGYENASKFTAVFKDQFGVLPSEFIK